MDTKIKKNNIGLLAQAVVASSVLLAPITAISAVETFGAGGTKAGGQNITAGSAVEFLTDVEAILAEGDAIGITTAADAPAPEGFSAFVTSGGGTSKGTLTIQGDAAGTTIGGILGTEDQRLNSVTVDAATANNVVIFEKDIFATGIQITDTEVAKVTLKGSNIDTTAAIKVDANGGNAHELTFDSSNNDINVTNQIELENADGGIINVTGGNAVTIAGDKIGVGQTFDELNVAAGTALIFAGTEAKVDETKLIGADSRLEITQNATFVGKIETPLVAGAILDINDKVLTVTDLDLKAGGILELVTSDDIETNVVGGGPHIVATNGAGVNGGAVINVSTDGYLSNNKVIQIVAKGAGAAVAVPATINGNSAVLTFTADNMKVANTLILEVERTEYTELDLAPDAAGAGSALEAAGQDGSLAANNPTLNQIVGIIDSAQTVDEVNTILSMIGPTSNLAAGHAAHLFTHQTIATISDRLNMIRMGDASDYFTGMSAGDFYEDWGVWGQLFGSKFTQDKRGKVLGYDGSTVGVSLGVDWALNPCSTFGLAVSYSSSDVDYDLADSTLDVDSIQGTLYGSFHNEDTPWYLQGMLGVAHHDYSQHRNIRINGIPNATAIGDFDGLEWLLQSEVGYIHQEGAWTMVPSFGLKFSHLGIDDYTETGANNLNIRVNNDDIEQFVASLDLLVQYVYVSGNSKMVPEAHARFNYDFIADRQASNSSFFGLNNTFSTQSFEPPHSSYEVGVGLNVHTSSQAVFSVNYDYLFASDFDSHSGFLKLRYEWM